MREVDFIFVAYDAGTQVANSGFDVWEVSSGIRLNDYGYAKSNGMNLRGGYITARTKGSKATKSANNFPTGEEILNAMQRCGDIKVHFGGSGRSRLYISWKSYAAEPGYLDIVLEKAKRFAGVAFGDVIGASTPAGWVWSGMDYSEKAKKTAGTVSTVLPQSMQQPLKFLAGKSEPLAFRIGSRSMGEGYTEMRKKRSKVSFEQIAGILAGSDIRERSLEGFGLSDMLDLAGDD